TWIAPSGRLTTSLGGGNLTIRRRVVNEGLMALGYVAGDTSTSAGVIRLGQGGVLENRSTLRLRSGYYALSVIAAGEGDAGKMVNTGVVENAEGSGSVSVAVLLENRGVVRALASVLNLQNVLFLDGGRVGAGSGSVRIPNDGVAEVAEGATALVESGALFEIGDASVSVMRLRGSGTLRVEGELRLYHGSVQEGSGVTWIAPSGRLTTSLGGGNLTIRRRVVNEGEFIARHGALIVGQEGSIENRGSLQFVSDERWRASIIPAAGAGRRTLINKGTILKSDGATTVSITVELRNEGKLHVSKGTLELANYYQTQTGTLEIGIGGTTASQFGQVNITGAAWLNGKLAAVLLNDFAPAVGASFQVLMVNIKTGDFRSSDLPGDMVPEWVNRTLRLTVAGGFFVSSAQPAEIRNYGSVQMNIRGSGFQQGAAVLLKKGDTVLEAGTVAVESIRSMRADFTLQDIPTGEYELVVRSPDNQQAKLATTIRVYDDRVLSVLEVEPAEVVQRPTLGIVNVHVRGTQFSSDAQVYLQRVSEAGERILPLSAQWQSETELQAAFDLSPTRAKIGTYELVVQRGANLAKYPFFVFPYMAIMSDAYVRPSVLVVGRVTRHTITLTNWGNAAGVGVYTLALPSGFELVNVYPAPGGEWGVTSDGTIVVAQPVQPGETVSIGVDVRLRWDNVIPPDQQPQPGKYRLGDRVLFKGMLVASPVQELWTTVRTRGGNNWEDIVAEAMIAHGAVTGVYMDEFMGMKVRGGHEFILHLGQQFPAIASALEQNLQMEMYAYAAAALGMNLFAGRTRATTRGEITPKQFSTELWDTLMLTAQYTAQDFVSGKVGALAVAQLEGAIEGLTFGLVQVNLTEMYAQNLGYSSLSEMQQYLGMESWQVAAMKLVGGGIGPSPLKLPVGGLINKIAQPVSTFLFSKLDGRRFFGDYVFSFGKGAGNEPTRFGIDKLVLVTTKTSIAEAVAAGLSLGRANFFHIGYMLPNPARGIAGGWHIGIGSVPKVVFTENGIKYLAAGPHFYLNRFFHPNIGEVRYDWLINSMLVSRGDLADQLSRLDREFLAHYLAEDREGMLGDFLDNWGVRLVAAWDPNSIEMSPSSAYIPRQQRLHFTVHFENLPQANFPAEDVTIRLVLDEDLDIDSVIFDDASHPQLLATAIDRETRTLSWRFAGINLPPNQNPPEGEGWVKFSANVRSDVASGAEVVAKAEIRFDENPPIVTNEVKVIVDAQPPTSRMAELPAEQSRGTFEVQWQAQDDVSGVAQSEVWYNEERADGRQGRVADSRMVKIEERTYVPLAIKSAGQELKARVRAKFGYTYRFFAVSKDAVDNLEAFPNQPQAVVHFGRAPQIPQGLRLVAVPVQSEDADPKTVFHFVENKWATWNPAANDGRGGYLMYPNEAVKFSQPERVPGKAFWAQFSNPITPRVFGYVPDDTTPFSVALQPGWNLVGNPWLVDILWNPAAIQVRAGDQTKPLSEAEGIVEPYAWRWDGNAYRLVYSAGTPLPNVDESLPAWEGAWVFAYQPC
ncbi:MAG: hypothetical protein NZ520_09805, partial [bacterium]|nr:hypothetical protein [bacterium]